MARAGAVCKICIVPTAGIGVADNRRQRCAAGDTLIQPAQKLRRIRLSAGGGQGILPRRPPGKKLLQGLHINGESCWQTVYGDPDRRGMRLPEYRYFEFTTVHAGHNDYHAFHSICAAGTQQA